MSYLRLAAKVTSCVGIDGPMLLKCVADGIIPAYKRQPSLGSLSFICFLDSMIGSIPDTIYAERGWISGYNFPKRTDISLGSVNMWVDSGLIEPTVSFGHRSYFDLQ